MSQPPLRVGRNAQLLKYFAGRSRRVGATTLMKLAYLADVEAMRYLGHPISEFSYRFHRHGPFDGALYTAREELVEAGLAEDQETRYPNSGYVERTLVDLPKPIAYDLSLAERAVLDYVYTKYGDLPLAGLLQVAYRTPPMRGVHRGQTLNMARVPPQTVFGFDLDALTRAQERIHSGNYVTLDQLAGELQAAARRASVP